MAHAPSCLSNFNSFMAGRNLVNATHSVAKIVPCLTIISGLFLNSCRHAPTQPKVENLIPIINNVAIQPNPNNALSAFVKIRAENAASVEVAFGVDSLLSEHTSQVMMTADSAHILVLGLKPETSYFMKVVAHSSNGNKVESQRFSFNTAALPEDVPEFSLLTNSAPTPGFVMMGLTFGGITDKGNALILNNDGQIVWYRRFQGSVIDFQKQPNGNFTVYTSADGSPMHFYEIDRAGNILREFRASNGWDTGPHELRLFDDRHTLFGIEFREMDLTAFGGLPNANVRGIVVEYQRDNAPPLLWHTFDHFQVTDAAPDVSLTTANVNPWHGNAIDIDADGHLLVSFRNCDEITKINAQTGEIIWRWGGRNNQFIFINDPLNGFSHQHGIRRLSNGNVILFDNGNLHMPPVSRAVEYRLDETAKTAELVWEYRHDPPLFGNALGFAQRLANGNTLICFGTAQHLVEVDQMGIKRWELTIANPQHFAYRAFRIASLY